MQIFLNNHFEYTKYEDSFFLYKQYLRHLQHMHEMHDAGRMLNSNHNAGGVYPNGAKLELELNAKLEEPLHEEDVFGIDDKS